MNALKINTDGGVEGVIWEGEGKLAFVEYFEVLPLHIPTRAEKEKLNIDRTFLGDFAKLRKASISFVMSVGPSVRMEQLGSHWTDFHEI